MKFSRLPRPRKRLGQHFLIDRNIVNKIISLAKILPSETVFEIGPGYGSLTRALCDVAFRVIAVELDPSLVAYLTDSLSDYPHLIAKTGDALTFPYETLPQGTVVVANLPYYVSTPLLFKLFENRDRLDRMILMLQLEVAKRLVAQPGTREYSALSVIAQTFAKTVLAFHVSASCFRPRPEVDSAVVHLSLNNVPVLEREFERSYVRTVRAAFSHRRKILANSLQDAGMSASTVQKVLSDIGIHPQRRAETLTLHEFQKLAEKFRDSEKP